MIVNFSSDFLFVINFEIGLGTLLKGREWADPKFEDLS